MAPQGRGFPRGARMAYENRDTDGSAGDFEAAAKKVSEMNNAIYQRTSSILQAHILREYNNQRHKEPWRNLPEVPTSAEIMPEVVEQRTEEKWDDYQKEFLYDEKLPMNKIDGPWPSKEAYVGAHYQLHREDAIACLRKSINHFKRYPGMMETQETAIYTNLTFTGLLCAKSGVAFRVEFSTDRCEKQIRWKQSKRLTAGTIVALSPQKNAFTSICKIGVIASRPYEGGLDQNPPQVDLFWGDSDDAAFDPAEKYIMIEARQGYFEASRHMLVALQKLMTEKFALANHIVSLDTDIKAPAFLEHNPYMNLNSLIESRKGHVHDESLLENVNMLAKRLPDIEPTSLDYSQMQACKSMLTKRISIIQGPPGTGKTHVSVTALKVMINNWVQGDPPIIITAQTNHALDQLLNHIMVFDKNVVRLGGRADKDNEEIILRTLYELRSKSAGMKGAPPPGEAMSKTRREYKDRVNSMKATLQPLLSRALLSTDVLREHAIMTQVQIDSLYEEGWGDEDEEANKNDLSGWLTPDQLMAIPQTPAVNMGLELEDTELEYEDIEEIEGEQRNEAKEGEGLSGDWFAFQRTVTGKSSPVTSSSVVRKYAREKNLYDIPVSHRGEVYRYWEKALNKKMLQQLKLHMKAYEDIVKRYEISKNMSNIKMIRFLGVKVVACTTTGLSKYRALLAALEPHVLLIEEAAETTEATVIAGMMDSLQQLILVGDHQQLQANCNVRELGVEPYHLNVSMFERLVNNGIGYTMLNQQRRMIKDARQLLTAGDTPFYVDLFDHPSVWDREVARPPIPGMGGRDTWFFHHNWPEAKNIDGSSYNLYEAEMISGFYNYLVLNGTDPSKITVLTFYNGQRKTIVKELQSNPNLRQYKRFKVHTVDSYQGEENDVILLSLVRSNERMGIGFLENRNRAVVALSRARRGMYMFGNSVTLVVGEQTPDYIGRPSLWSSIFKQLQVQKRMDIDKGIPTTCTNHGNTSNIVEPGEWVGSAGGCRLKCVAKLPCKHDCPYTCHPFPHEDVVCPAPCTRKVPSCGHSCSGTCGEVCYCYRCQADYQQSAVDGVDRFGNTHGSGRGRSGGRCDIRQESGYPDSSVPLWSNTKEVQQPATGNRGLVLPADGHFPKLAGHVSTPEKWQAWDAQAADKALYHERLRQQAERGPIDPDSSTFLETFKRTGLDTDGRRVQIGIERRTANGYSEEKKREVSVKVQSSTQTLADEFGVIPIAEGPSTFSGELSAWEKGQMASPNPQSMRADALSPTFGIARTVQSKRSERRAPRAAHGSSTTSTAPVYRAPRGAVQGSIAGSVVSGYRAPSTQTPATFTAISNTSSGITTETSPPLLAFEPTSTRTSSNPGPLIPGFEVPDVGSPSPEPVEEELLIDFS